MQEYRYLLVRSDMLPEIYHKVLQTKKLLALGNAKSVTEAVKTTGISRSAYYKYRDCVFDEDNHQEIATIEVSLLDEAGALQALLSALSDAGASIVTINQSTPQQGAVVVATSIRTATMQMNLEELADTLRRQKSIRYVQIK